MRFIDRVKVTVQYVAQLIVSEVLDCLKEGNVEMLHKIRIFVNVLAIIVYSEEA